MGSNDLSIDYLNDNRVLEWKNNLDDIAKTLSVLHSYENGKMTKETGPGFLVVQVADDSIEDSASGLTPNPFDERDSRTYMDEDIGKLYELFKDTSVEDGAAVIMGNGRVLETNVLLEPPKETYEQAESNPEYGAKHTWGARSSVEDDIIYTTALSSTDGRITTFVDGEQRDTPTRRRELIEEVNNGDAEWLIEEQIDNPERYDWLDLEPEELA